ncbi:sigma 54-interacting transcriptional regulator [Peptoniphilus equinus]|uniref:HTH-type transcriptional regulatory protein TyrR n=1 Tax=Peptoniphilus equinus TaxID=3016343 RepID=A0ABY7QSD3_9FIRM|nr:sigma 54-interacting transcriptional regulator [Peptoniphilus equinus]WBW49376.1 sigma 54-interacting transcriptional regulator [Peptoniphilus equinus]
MQIKRVKIIFKINRPHLTFDMLKVLQVHDIPVLSMEVYSNVIYLKLPEIASEIYEAVYEEWENVYGFDHIEEIGVMSFEEKDIEIKSVLNLISEGVVLLSKNGTIEYVNKLAREYLVTIKDGEAITAHISDTELDELISTADKTIKNKICQIQGRNFLLNADKLFSEENIFIGYLVTLKEIGEPDFSTKSYITFDEIVGKSESLINAVEMAKLFANADASILLLGESGTGKEMFARAIHSYSRPNEKFMGINCAAIPEELLESELFGYEKGAFTGAKSSGKMGIFEACSGGSIFLDEIGELNYHLQAKLLRVIQEGKIRRLGSNREIDVNTRVISATNRNLLKLIEEGRFRLDLFYRLNTFSVEIPPLRARMEDLDILTHYFLEKMRKRYNRTSITFSEAAKNMLRNYSWPGNIRELQNVLERAVVLSNNGDVLPKHIKFDHDEVGIEQESGSLKDAVENFEKQYIKKVLKESNSIRGAAKKLHTTHTLLINRMKKYSIDKM